MAFSEKKKKQIVAITKKLREDKGIIIKKHELDHDINEYRKKQKALEDIEKKYEGTPAVQEAARDSKNKLQSIIDDLNDYMSVLHPEGLIDIGPSAQGGSMSISG